MLHRNRKSGLMLWLRHPLRQPFPNGRKLFSTTRVDPKLASKLTAHGVKVTGAPSSNLFSTILSAGLAGAGVRSPRCARLRLAPRISAARTSVPLFPRDPASCFSAATSLRVLSPDRCGGSGDIKALCCLSAPSVRGG
jgi:hypothetical protein